MRGTTMLHIALRVTAREESTRPGGAVMDADMKDGLGTERRIYREVCPEMVAQPRSRPIEIALAPSARGQV